MTKLAYLRLEQIENRFDRNHPGRRLAKRWYKEVLWTSDIFGWVWATEITKPNPEAMRLSKSDSVQLESIKLEKKVWRDKRESSWIEIFWSSDWEHGRRVTGSFYQHLDDPTIPSETETSQLFGVLLASIPTEVFAWAQFHKKVWSRSYEKRYMKHRDLMDVTVEYTVEDFLHIESRAQYWLEKLGPQRPEDIPLPTWASNAKLFGHGKTETYPESKICDQYASRFIRAYENWVDVWNMIEKVIEADKQKQINEIRDV